MFGNLLGWIIAAAMAAVAGYGGYLLLQFSSPTPPTGWVQANVKPLDLTDVVMAALPPMNDPRDDAGSLYRQAIDDYDQHKDLYQQLQNPSDFDEAKIAQLKGLDLICQAASSSSMHLLSTDPGEAVGYPTNVAALDKLNDLAKTLSDVGLIYKADQNYELATKYANALAAMGYRLYKERVAYCELDAGESALGAGNQMLLEIAQAEHDEAKAQLQGALKQRRMDEFKNSIQPVEQVISDQSDQDLSEHSGDMFQIALDRSIDRVWRVEAIRKLGRLQKNATKLADQVKAPKVLGQLANDSTEDLVIRTAAVKARDITSYENQSQR